MEFIVLTIVNIYLCVILKSVFYDQRICFWLTYIPAAFVAGWIITSYL